MTDTPPPTVPQPAQPVQPSPTPTPASASAPAQGRPYVQKFAETYKRKAQERKEQVKDISENIDSGSKKIQDKYKEKPVKEKPSKKEVTEEPKERRPVGRPRGGGRGRARDRRARDRAPGLELPKQGLHRFGHATAGLDYEMFQGGKSLNTYADPFSMGTEMSGMAAAGGNRRASDQMSVDFGRLSTGLSLSGLSGVGSAKKAMKRDGNARGFSGYQDPFSGSAPAPRGIGSKPRGRPPKKNKKVKGEKLARSLFNLRLF